jgi:hypothetical protein
MRNETTNENSNYIKGLRLAALISGAFFIVSIIGKESELWGTILKICIGYGLSIYTMIWLSYWSAAKFFALRSTGKQCSDDYSFSLNFGISFFGLCLGALIGQAIRSYITGNAINYAYLPFLILIGSFVSLAFIYKDKNKRQELENIELGEINQKLKERKDKKYATSFTTKIGSGQKVIQVTDVLYFKSIDHYTHACTEDGEYIIDTSIKALSEELNPSLFIQVHRNCIVSIDQIDSITNGSQWFIKTRLGDEFKVSRGSRKRLKEVLGK